MQFSMRNTEYENEMGVVYCSKPVLGPVSKRPGGGVRVGLGGQGTVEKHKASRHKAEMEAGCISHTNPSTNQVIRKKIWTRVHTPAPLRALSGLEMKTIATIRRQETMGSRWTGVNRVD